MLPSEKKQRLEEIARNYKLKMVLVFGSAAKERLHRLSDIDVAVLAEDYGSLSFSRQSDMHYDIQRLFEGKEVDLVFLNQADPLFMKKILENCILLYGNEGDLARLKIYAFKRYVDHKKYFELERKYAEKFIRQKMERRGS